ncbi:hypothetical protein [Brevibacillus reuszeri]|uniref:hypothetical protein n=1 Tax=Brevibacillus reuszeri TaxID=54915 RepID=UPI000CCC0E39|nr:hypothetical protein [Brevibacillus reuszeri]
MTTLAAFLKEYLLDNYDDIQSESHAEDVSHAVEFYVSHTLIPEMILQFSPGSRSGSSQENELEEAGHGRYQERLESYLTSVYGHESVISILFENQDVKGEYFLVRLIVNEEETEKQIRVCYAFQPETQEDIQYYASDSNCWFSVGELP